MMVTIRGLPSKVRYQDIKLLLKSECNLIDYVLDKLVIENNGLKAVRVGLAEDSDGYHIIKCLDGFQMSGSVLNVEPVGKQVPSNPPHQGNYEPGYSNHPRNEYPNEQNNYPGQPSSNHMGGNYHHSRFEGTLAAHGSSFTTPTQSHGPHAGPGIIHSPWSSNMQWPQNQTMSSQDSYGYQQPGAPNFSQQYSENPQRPEAGQYLQTRAQNDPGFALRNKGNTTKSGELRHAARPHVLRNVEIVDSSENHPVPSGRYPSNQPYQPQEKPVTIMKDNFKGPTTYDIGSSNPQSAYQKQRHSSPQPWAQQGHQTKPQTYDKSNPAHFEKKHEAVHWNHPADKMKEPRQQMIRSDGNRNFERPGTRFSPRRDIERSLSPSRRLVSPARRRGSASPVRRRGTPSRQVIASRDGNPRRVSPRGRMVSPSGRRYSPTRRLASPPVERRGGPPRELSPRNQSGQKRVPRYSPERHRPDKQIDKNINVDTMKMSKQVRPAYEASPHAPNQALYSGGYRPSVHENAPYPRSSRQTEDMPWRNEGDKMYSSMKKHDEERRGSPKRNIYAEKHSPRKSRSPDYRDRSPIRDHYRKRSHSSRSPRRSWAFEKRRSPEVHEVPPPPVWPGHDIPDDSRYDRKVQVPKHVPVWESRSFNKVGDAKRPNVEGDSYVSSGKAFRNEFENNSRTARGERLIEDKRDMKLGERNEFTERRESFHYAPDAEPKPYPSRREREYRQSVERENRRSPDGPRKKEPLRLQKERTNNLQELHNDFGKVYKKAEEFKRTTEERLRRRTGDSEERGRTTRDMEDKERRDRTATSPHHRRHDSQRQLMDFSPRRQTDDLDRNRMGELSRQKLAVSPHRRTDETSHHTEITRRGDSRDRDPIWEAVDVNRERCPMLPVHIKMKRDKAADELAHRIINKHLNVSELDDDVKRRIRCELKKVITFKFTELFHTDDVSFIELVIKFQSKVSDKEIDWILNDITKSLPGKCRSWKTLWPDSSDAPEKKRKRSAEYNLKEEIAVPRPRLSDSNIPDWQLNIDPPTLQMPTSLAAPTVPLATMNITPIGNQLIAPQLLASVCAPQDIICQPYFELENQDLQMNAVVKQNEDDHCLFLRRNDFKPFTVTQADKLKDFIVSEIVNAIQNSDGWVPDFTFKGLLDSMHRYVIFTRDEKSKFWLMNLNFSQFTLFDILVYTQEELWYERAAIWLPGHVQFSELTPFDKIKFQNMKLDGVNIGKWKLVKQIMKLEGTMLYVDMPPSSARELEKHNKMLSYELGKVEVYLRAEAVDQVAFDAGLKEVSITNKDTLIHAALNAPMPTIPNTPLAVKITRIGCKFLSFLDARKIKEHIIRQIFRDHQFGLTNKRDFINYGIIAPNYFGVIPENAESKKWLFKKYSSDRFAPMIAVGSEDHVKYYKISVIVPNEHNITARAVLKKLEHNNRGSGVDFRNWKALQLKLCNDKAKVRMDIDIDIKSIDKLISLNYQLDYMNSFNKIVTVDVKCDIPEAELLEAVKENKQSESTDNYDVANMDLGSDEENSDIVCLD